MDASALEVLRDLASAKPDCVESDDHPHSKDEDRDWNCPREEPPVRLHVGQPAACGKQHEGVHKSNNSSEHEDKEREQAAGPLPGMVLGHKKVHHIGFGAESGGV